MYIKNINKRQFICFTQNELSSLYKAAKLKQLMQEMSARGVTLKDLAGNHSRMEEIANMVGDRGAADRDEHEIFAGLFVFAQFYGNDSEICFELQDSFSPQRDRIVSLADLINLRKTDTESDFMIKAEDGFRDFQLKRYRGPLQTQAILDFIIGVVRHYGNNLGDTNLLIQLQSPSYTHMDADFHDLHNQIASIGFPFLGQVLVSYNDNNKSQAIIQVHPKLTKTEIPLLLPSQR
ncbi:MAG: hypothetical protein NUV53_03110 [Patescibacteria group bacterium]|nr:hypothetical protein [Patescibacteria group bacterium]